MKAVEVMVMLMLLLMLMLVASTESQKSSHFTQHAAAGCADEAKAAAQPKARSDIEYSLNSLHASVCDPVAQWNPDTKTCSVFEMQVFCHLSLSPTGNCQKYMKSASAKCFNKKLTASWIFSSNANSRKSLVHPDGCSSRHELQAENVVWKEEGVEFNGANSKMSISSDNFMSSATGFTWMIRMKRSTHGISVLESFTCGTSDVGPHVLSDSPAAKGLYYSTWMTNAGPNGRFYTANALPADNSWFNIAITVIPGNNTVNLFAGNAYVPQASVTHENVFASSPQISNTMCYCFGCRENDAGLTLHGTIRAVGIANTTLTEDEVNQFFNKVTG